MEDTEAELEWTARQSEKVSQQPKQNLRSLLDFLRRFRLKLNFIFMREMASTGIKIKLKLKLLVSY